MNSLHIVTLVLDTNSLLRGLANRNSAAGKVLWLCENRNVKLLLSRAVIAEYRMVLGSEEVIARNPEITQESVELVLRRLRYLGEYVSRVSTRFHYERDVYDEKFIELAIFGRTTHIISSDKDLLTLSSGHGDAARRFRQRLPGARVLTPAEFMHDFEAGTI